MLGVYIYIYMWGEVQVYLHEKMAHFQTTSISKEMDLKVIRIEPRLDSYKKAHFSCKAMRSLALV